jgi:hypothetical protein
MSLKYFTPAFLLLLSLLTMNFKCVKDPVLRPYEYSFEAPVSINPVKKTYSLTDTIWVETDVPSKFLFDTKSNQNVAADTGAISFSASFNIFGTSVQNPSTGFCSVITPVGVNAQVQPSQWGTGVNINNFGCGLPNYRLKTGFKPNVKGTFWLILPQSRLMGSCSNKVIPYNAAFSCRFKNVDLGLDVFNTLSTNDKGGRDGIEFYTNKINNREVFVFSVQ